MLPAQTKESGSSAHPVLDSPDDISADISSVLDESQVMMVRAHPRLHEGAQADLLRKVSRSLF